MAGSACGRQGSSSPAEGQADRPLVAPPSAASVDVMGDFTAWQPVRLTRSAGGSVGLLAIE